MHPRSFLPLCFCLATVASAGQPPRLHIHPGQEGSVVALGNPGVAPVAGTRYRLRLESSTDLRHWQDEGDWDQLAGEAKQLAIPPGAHRFFRAAGEVVPGGTADGADIFGYAPVFKEELARIGWLTPEDFAANLPHFDYLEELNFDPTTALYWDQFNTDPAVANEGLSETDPGYRLYDFRLNDEELALFQRNGFVVSERLGSTSFGDVYYRIFSDDFPVIITADSVLHAWHYSYQRMLEELEELQLAPALEELWGDMRGRLAALPEAVLTGPLADSVGDADYFLAVAASLLGGTQVPVVRGGDDQNRHVTETLEAIARREYAPEFELFGAKRRMDFSQFTVRGHYERSELLGRYFRTFMWCAQADLRIFKTVIQGTNPGSEELREMGTAVVLAKLLDSSALEQYDAIDGVVQLFVGRQDSMTCSQMRAVLEAAGIDRLEDVTSADRLVELGRLVADGGLGSQLYAGHVFASPLGPEQAQFPCSFTFLGQRFVPDGWAISQVTFDRIRWFEELPASKTFFGKVVRKRTSALDVAWSVLGNQQPGDLIAARMMDLEGEPLRDGLPYAHNLEAVAATFQRLESQAWEDSIYTRWLHALRALSEPTTDVRFPEAMRTRAWAHRMLNTQLGSYTQLKHDTILYAKQPYSSTILCEYPAGFVEPVPEFWERMGAMAEATADGMSVLPATGVYRFTHPDYPQSGSVDISRAERLAARMVHCRRFASKMRTLAGMAAKELRQEPFTEEETNFIRSLMNRHDEEYYGASYSGWYPALFYKDYGQWLGNTDTQPCNEPDLLVTDIFTSVPGALDPKGGVLHEGVGDVDLMLIAIDNGPDRMVYAGPTMSHYEFTAEGTTRLTDGYWGWKVLPETVRPEWTRDYLVTKPVEP